MQIFVLFVFTRSPHSVEYFCSFSRKVWSSVRVLVNKIMSSAKNRRKKHIWLKLMPVISPPLSVFLRSAYTLLIKRINSKGDNGSPCFTPSAISKKLDTSDCILTAANTLSYRDCNLRVSLQLKPLSTSLSQSTSCMIYQILFIIDERTI